MSFRFAAVLGAAAVLALPAAASGARRSGLPTHADTAGELASHTRAISRTQWAPRDLRLDGLPAALPSDWCGSASGADDAAHASYPEGVQKIHVVYTHPSDQPDRLRSYAADRIQRDIVGMVGFVAAQPGSQKSLRFDMGTSCGGQYVDIVDLALNQPAAAYLNPDNPFAPIYDEISSRWDSLGIPRSDNILVYADSVSSGNAAGQGMWVDDDNPDPAANAAASGGMVAIVYVAPGSRSWYGPGVPLHEVTHNLGAVNNSSTSNTGRGHCLQELDVMCYDDGSGRALIPGACPAIQDSNWPEFSDWYDCRGDDYFNPSPPPGSYLSSHWNTYNSPFMCPEAECVPAGSGAHGDVTAPGAPGRPQLRSNRGGKIRFTFLGRPASEGVARYKVTNRGRDVRPQAKVSAAQSAHPAVQVSARRGQILYLRVIASDQAGNASKASAALRVRVR